MIYLSIFNIIGFEIKMSTLNIVRCSCSDKGIANILIYVRQLTLFPSIFMNTAFYPKKNLLA